MADLLEVRDLQVWFPVKRGVFARTTGQIKAVDGVSFKLERGESLGIVGESGSGKSTLVRTIAGLQKPTGGSFTLNGRVAMVFQDPLGSLNPRQTVRAALDEVLRVAGRSDAELHTPEALLEAVGLDADALDKYPHEFSGGQRQRVCIARALASDPELLICDEAVSALDLTLRAQVLALLADLRKRLGLTLLFITHDLGVVRHIADRLLVMYAGKVVESGSCDEVLLHPKEDYTKRLIGAVLKIG